MPGVTASGPVTANDLHIPLEQVRAVEQRAARAWPATFVHEYRGWHLRHSPGVPNRRSNSVLPNGGVPPDEIDAAIEDVEVFYAERSLPSRFMISPAADPNDLDQRLADVGYRIEAPTDVQWADTGDIVSASGNGTNLVILDDPTDEWMSVYLEGERDQQAIADKKLLIERIACRRALVCLQAEGKTVSVGLGVLDDGWTGAFCMHTLKEKRRSGYGRVVLGALARWSEKNGAAHMYLQVERDNPDARRFYERAGFVTRYGYRYRSKTPGDGMNEV